MTDTCITPRELREMLVFAAERIAQQESRLNALDGAIGDGDHGITMRLGFEAVKNTIKGLDANAGFATVLNQAGAAFMGATGGAMGVILGRMLMAGGAALRNHQALGPAEYKALLASMETAGAQAGKAKPGDKTVIDAIHAAQEALQGPGEHNEDLTKAASRAATAAETASQETANLVCRVGRASRLGNRALGHPDPGATSFALILRAFAEWLEENSRTQ